MFLKIIKTFIKAGNKYATTVYIDRAREMLDWLLSIQLGCGGFAGSTINKSDEYAFPVVFNTGQILIGLVAGYKQFGRQYERPMIRAADWLLSVQEVSGEWIKGASPVAKGGVCAYNTHVAYGLIEVTKATNEKKYLTAAINNLMWTLNLQKPNGWFSDCCLSDSTEPLTHTIGYAIRGIWEGFEYTKNEDLLKSAILTADSIVKVVNERELLPGRLNSEWQSSVEWQ